MLISHYQHLLKEEGIPLGRELILRGAEERLVRILMTALTTGLVLMLLAISGDLPGHEIEHPMALVILAGLITATCMNLFILPVFYAKITRSISYE